MQASRYINRRGCTPLIEGQLDVVAIGAPILSSSIDNGASLVEDCDKFLNWEK